MQSANTIQSLTNKLKILWEFECVDVPIIAKEKAKKNYRFIIKIIQVMQTSQRPIKMFSYLSVCGDERFCRKTKCTLNQIKSSAVRKMFVSRTKNGHMLFSSR